VEEGQETSDPSKVRREAVSSSYLLMGGMTLSERIGDWGEGLFF